jgi:hypothetical protein
MKRISRGKMHRQVHEHIAHLGLDNFESLKECAERQAKMVARIENDHGRGPHLWNRCEPGYCAGDPCSDGCWFASRRWRYVLIREGHRLLSACSALHFVSVAHPRWEIDVGKLRQANIPATRQWLYRRFRRLDGTAIAIGGYEVSLNVDLDGCVYWAGHVHLLAAGARKNDIKRILSIQKQYRATRYARLVDIREVDNLGRQLGYSLKRFAQRRVAYIDEQGRQNRRVVPLKASEQREFDAWLLGLPVGARTILIGCRLHGSRLRAVKSSHF